MQKTENPARSAETAPVAYRGELIPLVRSIRREIGLSTGDILALSALLSFLPCRSPDRGEDIPITPGVMTVVFPSNEALCERANGMDERVMRRHIARLRDAGLILRRDSPTRKRFPVRIGGQIVRAYGFDLAPLIHRLPELRHTRDQAKLRAERIRALRMHALTERLDLIREIGETDRLVDIGRILRRSTITERDIEMLLQEISDIRGGLALSEVDRGQPNEVPESPSAVWIMESKPKIDDDQPLPSLSKVARGQPCEAPASPSPVSLVQSKPEIDDDQSLHPLSKVDRGQPQKEQTPTSQSANGVVSSQTPDRKISLHPHKVDRGQPWKELEAAGMSGATGQNVRHIDPPQIDKKKIRRTSEPTSMLSDWRSYTEISALFPEPPSSAADLVRILMEVGSMLRIAQSDIGDALKRIGVTSVMRVLDYISKNHENVRSPGAYLRKITRQGESSPAW